ncbi:subtilisin-like protein [Artomyces pyxidatus]|uniref:Subtilisin-like protein n=1 Tax=Artomyces pyxidatus TaxID=48021 RepID=A0ACB8TBZ5_9AGAM|nr:subtilisin-like protein [Artomyces pyxidatus]
MFKAALVLLSLFSATLSTPHIARDLRLHESRDDVPDGFTHNGPAAGDTPLRLRLALKQNDIEGLQDVLMDVSTPTSANYGKHLSLEEVNEYVTPKPETIAAVNAWLSENGLTAKTLSPAGDWLGFQTTVAQANRLFDADFSAFTHDATGETTIRTLAYSIPASLQGHLDLVHPTITFPNPLASKRPVSVIPRRSRPPSSNITSDAAPASCNTAITPSCVQELYGIPTTPATQSSNTLAVSGFIGQFANEADLTQFLKMFRPDIDASTTFTLQTLDGGSNPQSQSEAGLEADLDTQYTIGIATGVPTFFISVGDNTQDGDLDGFLDIINFLLAEDTPPQVLTTSYGQNENTISRSLAISLCNAYMQLGARGTSILFASGDGGVQGSQAPTICLPGQNFVPTFPSGCPFMTSVGATQNVNPEVAASFSSGGFSNYFATPAYQSAAKSAYLTGLGNTHSGKFNASGRGFPDVAALGVDVQIVNEGAVTSVEGTSCASPIFASVVALLNDQLIAAGKPPLGFLNPFLYSTGASALNSITSGSNEGCITEGFPAKAGWNPVTGLGTPNFAKLLAAVGL